VYGLIDFDRDGAAAEYCTVPAADLAGRPRTVPHAEAAALPLSALTAWQALVDHAALTPGETVLVHGGAGGVGVFAVQLAALLGGRVATTARGEDAGFLRRLGAERVIDRAAEEFDQVVSGVDVVIDTVGGTTLRRSYEVVRPGGRVVTLGAPPPPDLAGRHGVQSLFFIVRPDRAQLTRLAELVDAGDLRPVVGETFPLAEARRAFESGALGHRRGKTVLVVR
jgi:NADPH:quinone reductase-like Zn-dependent oxidoreductase